MQHRSTALPQIVSWQRTRLGKDAATPIDELQAVRDFVTELASIIVAGRPSAGAEACRACEALARKRWPRHFIVEDEISEWLKPLTWFETEIDQVFGLDVLAAAELRACGWAEAHNDWVEILVLRFENLAELTPEIGRFMNVTELVLPRKNVTKSKHGASEIVSAIQAALDSPIGQACAGELWKSRYAKACGYPLPKGGPILGTGTITSQASHAASGMPLSAAMILSGSAGIRDSSSAEGSLPRDVRHS
jgi:hypothetical protein